MATTKQIYTLTAPWTSVQFFDTLRLAFIDAGLMTEWYASYGTTNTPNRVLKITYDESKTYGSTYYWFTNWYAGTFYYKLATGFDPVNNIPTGTQYLDYFNTSAVENDGYPLISMNASADLNIIRYSSNNRVGHTWFNLSQNGSQNPFHIAPASSTFQPWVDFNKGFLNMLYDVSCYLNGYAAGVEFIRRCTLRRELGKGIGLAGSATSGEYYGGSGNRLSREYRYLGAGRVNNDAYTNISSIGMGSGVFLPIGFSDINPAYTSDSSPVFHSLPYSYQLAESLPNDFGVVMMYTANTLAVGDKIIVTPGVEEWEIITRINSSTIYTKPSAAFCARVV
jgi:hypothetical protein